MDRELKAKTACIDASQSPLGHESLAGDSTRVRQCEFREDRIAYAGSVEGETEDGQTSTEHAEVASGYCDC